MAIGATGRVIALPTGLFVIALAFCPRLAAAFSIMPVPVMGAVLVYVACFMIVGGLQVITSRLLDIRRTFAVGIALIFGLSVEIVGLFSHVPSALAPVFSSALSLTTVLVVGLTLLFRIGVAKYRRAELIPDGRGNLYEITQLLLQQGATWGMRTEVVMHATDAIHELMIALQSRHPATPVA